MYAEERQQATAQLVMARGRISVTELAEEFHVTTETVRRDLSVLERQRVIRRVHGGAVPATSLTAIESGLEERDVHQSREKERIALAARAFLPPTGGTIAMDAGTTTARLVDLLPVDLSCTMFTHSVPLAGRLAAYPAVDLHLLPGRVRRKTQAAVGAVTIEALDRLRVDVAFLGTNAISIEHGCSTPDPEEAAVKRALARIARRVVVLADATKFARDTTVNFADLDEIDVLITDAAEPAIPVDTLTTYGIEVVHA